MLGIRLPNSVQYIYYHAGKVGYLSSVRLCCTLFHVTATMFVLADPYIWVGMITKQNSPIHETILAMMSDIFLCRLAQLAASFFLFDLQSQNQSSTPDNYTNEHFLFVFGQLTSLSLLILIPIRFGSASGFVFSLSQSGLWTSCYIQLFFILCVRRGDAEARV